MLTYSTNNTIHEGVKKLNYTELLRKLIDTDVITQEAIYHKQCYSLFVLKAKKIPSAPCISEYYGKSDAFDRLLSIVDHEIFQERRVLDMKSLLEKYYTVLREGAQQAYRSDKLKACPENHYKKRLVFSGEGKKQIPACLQQ